ncbi:MAG: hypothetical protein NTY03_00475 [Candidatus Bathyarchaeota archaeon]|nr:hypothetical protein [Candidatus Bathyarchaeota archaeon]
MLVEGAESLLGAVREFVALSGEDVVRGSSLVRAKEFMAVLRRCGFSSGEISELSGGRWDSVTVRLYTSGWGSVVDSSMKESIMGKLRGLASSGRSLGDVANFLDVKKSVEAKRSSMERVAELDAKLGLIGGDPEALLRRSEEMLQAKLTVKQVGDRIDLDNGLLTKYGFNHSDMVEVKKLCVRYGGLEKVREAVETFGSISYLYALKKRLGDELLETQKQLDEQRKTYNTFLNANLALSTLILSGWKSNVLAALPTLLRRSDTPEKFKEALNGIDTLEELNVRISKARDEEARITNDLKAVKELVEKDEGINASYAAVRYNEVIRNLTYMMVSPEKVKLSSEETAGYLINIILYFYAKILNDPSAPEVIKKTVGEINDHVSVLAPYGVKTWEGIEERSRQRQALGQQPS